MRKVGQRCRNQSVDIYKWPNQLPINTSADGSFNPQYPSTPTLKGFQCGIQYDTEDEIIDESGRITELRRFKFIFHDDPGLDPRDMLIWTDVNGNKRTAFVRSTRDMGFRGACYSVKAWEKS